MNPGICKYCGVKLLLPAWTTCEKHEKMSLTRRNKYLNRRKKTPAV